MLKTMRLFYPVSLFLFCIHTIAFGQAAKDTLLADELKQMAGKDQKIQEDFMMASSDSTRKIIKKQMQQTFDENCGRIKEIFQRHGYPGWDIAGREGSHHFWLLVQHCDSDPGFQEKVLKSMKKQTKRNNADKGKYAYLVDRVRVNQGQKQIYGTQMEVKDVLEGYTPKPLEKPRLVNKRRQQMGLIPLEAYLKKMNDSFFILNKDKIEQERKKRQQKD